MVAIIFTPAFFTQSILLLLGPPRHFLIFLLLTAALTFQIALSLKKHIKHLLSAQIFWQISTKNITEKE